MIAAKAREVAAILSAVEGVEEFEHLRWHERLAKIFHWPEGEARRLAANFLNPGWRLHIEAMFWAERNPQLWGKPDGALLFTSLHWEDVESVATFFEQLAERLEHVQ